MNPKLETSHKCAVYLCMHFCVDDLMLSTAVFSKKKWCHWQIEWIEVCLLVDTWGASKQWLVNSHITNVDTKEL